jgi:hypothetical protein
MRSWKADPSGSSMGLEPRCRTVACVRLRSTQRGALAVDYLQQAIHLRRRLAVHPHLGARGRHGDRFSLEIAASA